MKTQFLVAFIVLSCVVLACGDGDGGSDVLVPGGSISPGASRANETVTSENIYEALQPCFEMIFNSNYRGVNTISAGGNTISTIRLVGNANGYAYMRPTLRDSTVIGVEEVLRVNADYLSFFSDDNALFVTGELDLYSEWLTSSKLRRFIVDGHLDITGDYDYTVQFDNLWIGLDGNGSILDLTEDMPVDRPTMVFLSLMSGGEVVVSSDTEYNPYEETERDGVTED